MIKKISINSAAKIMALLLLSSLLFHLLILTGLIPYSAVWGGRLENRTQMYRFETFSIVINLYMLLVISVKGALLRINIPGQIITLSLWLFFILYSLNSIGNLLSANIWETVLFTPLTLLAALLSFRLAIEKES
jgi:hypothetical protein